MTRVRRPAYHKAVGKFSSARGSRRDTDVVTTDVLQDSYGRAIRDLRVSVTDRCNFRCFYCLPHGEPPSAPKEQMLTYEEIVRAATIFVAHGIEKVRLTGGACMDHQ